MAIVPPYGYATETATTCTWDNPAWVESWTDYTVRITDPAPPPAAFEPRQRRKQRVRWEAWSNQHHAPAYRVFKPVVRELPCRERLLRDRPPKSRRFHMRSSAVPMMPY